VRDGLLSGFVDSQFSARVLAVQIDWVRAEWSVCVLDRRRDSIGSLGEYAIATLSTDPTAFDADGAAGQGV
jgi:hypothetical protein